MTAVVFVGPSLAAADLASGQDLVRLPPAAVGDVYRAARDGASAIGIVDGYFDGVPSVWHKEILWTIGEGIPVSGAASMGALRAAELHAFGMRGVGRIFEWFRDGTLEDDDEVAVLHGPAETGYLALSEPMVNFRATLEQATREAVIAPATHDALRDIAKRLFYQDRAWDAVLDHPDARRLPDAEREALRAWLPGGRIDAKRADALALLGAIGEPGAADAPPSFHLEWTTMWDKAVALASERRPGNDAADRESAAGVLEELRLDDGFEAARDAAMLRGLAGEGARLEGDDPDRAAILEAIGRFRSERSLFARADLDRWLADNDIDPEGFERLMATEARMDRARSSLALDLDAWLLDAARMSGAYPRLAARARDKRRVLDELGLDVTAGGPGALELRLWFFESRLGGPMPDDVDGFARTLGFESRDAFDHALAREYLYERATGGG